MPKTLLPVISVEIPNHGVVTVTSEAIDAAMAAYLPASPYSLRAIVTERTGHEIDYSDVKTVFQFLAILADFDHNVDSSPIRAYA